MVGKTIRLMVVLATAVGVPYVWFNKSLAGKVKTQFASWMQRDAAAGHDVSLDGPAALQAAGGDGTAPVVATLSGAGVSGLGDALRFDISPRWVTQRWSRISTFRAEQGFSAMRVPLVTGTAPHDLAGSLTYYFDTRHRVQRITFYGHTGDEWSLVAMATQQFHMQPSSDVSAGLYLSRWNGQPTNLLHIAHAPVVRAQSPHGRLEVTLEVNRPEVGFRLSASSQQLLDQLRGVRW